MVGKEAYIRKLSANLEPVKPLKKPLFRWAIWLAGALVTVTSLMLSLKHFRPGFMGQLSQLSFLLESTLAAGSLGSVGVLLYQLSIPGKNIAKKFYILSLLPVIGFFGFILIGHLGHPSLPPTMSGKRPFCFYEILVWSWIPILAMTYQLQKSFFYINRLRGFLIGLAGATLPMALMQVACMYDPAHILSHHIAPLLYIAMATALISPWLLKSRL